MDKTPASEAGNGSSNLPEDTLFFPIQIHVNISDEIGSEKLKHRIAREVYLAAA